MNHRDSTFDFRSFTPGQVSFVHYGQQGWVCPRCQSVYAPFVRKCDDCGPEIRGNATVNVPPITWEITQASSGDPVEAWVYDLERRGLAKRAEVS